VAQGGEHELRLCIFSVLQVFGKLFTAPVLAACLNSAMNYLSWETSQRQPFAGDPHPLWAALRAHTVLLHELGFRIEKKTVKKETGKTVKYLDLFGVDLAMYTDPKALFSW